MEEKKDVVNATKRYDFEEEDRSRINWMMNQVQGTHVLDVGCFKGYTSILLGREGKNVLGIDSSSSMIDDALQSLKAEEADIRKNVLFEKSNFFERDFTNTKFDSILLGGILEHISDLDTFFHKAFSILNEQGRMVVSTSFGLNENINSKRIFYIHDFLRLQQPNLSISAIEYGGSWIGVIFQKTEASSSQKKIDLDLLKDLEKAFLLKEQSSVKKQENGQPDPIEEDVYQKFLDEKIAKVKAQKELYEQYKKEKEIYNAYTALKKEHEKVLKSYKHLKNQLDKIKRTFVGKVAFKLWRILKGKR